MTSRRSVVFRITVSAFISLLALTGCKSQHALHKASLDSMAVSHLGPSPLAEYNPSKTYILYKQPDDTLNRRTEGAKYVVYRIKDKQIVLDGKYTRGYVKWLNNTMLEILSVPDNVKPEQDLRVYTRQVYIEGP